MNEELPRFLDFEASGLGPASYPIEVAWSEPDGEVRESWLIEPAPDWRQDAAWEPAAERVHGLSYATLLDQGQPVREVAARMNDALIDCELWVDGGAFDRLWCETLFVAARLTPSFRLVDFWERLLERIPPSRTRRSGWQYGLQDAAWRRVLQQGGGRRHRAATDVRYLVALYRLAVGRQGG